MSDPTGTPGSGDRPDRPRAPRRPGTQPGPPTGRPTMVAPPAPPHIDDVDRTRTPLRPPIEFKPQWVVAAVAAGVAADIALRRPPWNNLAGTVLTFVLLGGLLASGMVKNRSNKVLIGVAAVVASFLSLRTDPILTTANLTAIVGLTLVAISRRGSFFDYRPMQFLRDGLEVIVQAAELGVEGPVELHTRSVRARERRGDRPSVIAGIVRGLLVAVPLVLVLGLLLGSADAVFASFFSFGSVNTGGAIAHLTLFAIGVAMMALLIRLAAAPGAGDVDVHAPTLGRIETFVVLGSMNALFGLFAAAQVVAKTESGDAVLEAAGLTYKAHARQGFFQLLWVAGITLGVVLTLRVVSSAWRSGRAGALFRGVALVSVGLTLVIVAVAFTRLQLYIGDDGLTPLRFYSSVFSLWVGLAFVLVAIRVLDVKADKAWTMGALGASSLAVLIGLNVVNPERIMAENNLDRDESSLLWHVEQFSGDGEATIIDGLDRLNPELREAVTNQLCERSTYRPDAIGDSDGGLFSWNLGRRSAESGLAELCE